MDELATVRANLKQAVHLLDSFREGELLPLDRESLRKARRILIQAWQVLGTVDVSEVPPPSSSGRKKWA